MIFSEEHGFRAPDFRKRRRGCRLETRWRLRACHYWDVHAEQAALPWLAVNMDESTVLPDDSVSRGQSHARAFSALFCREEGFEDSLARLRFHSHPRIGDRQYSVPARRDRGIKATIRVVEFDHLRFDHQPPAFRHGIPRVEAKIHEYLLDLRGVGLDRLERRGDEFELDIFADHFIQEIHQTR